MPAAAKTGADHPFERTRRVLLWLWLGAAAVVLLFPLRLWTKPIGRAMLSTPARTVVDHADPAMARRWLLLERAADHLPAGATVTFRAADPEAEMELYMLARARLGKVRSLPSSYYGQLLPESLQQAEYVIAEGQAAGLDRSFEEIQDLGQGALLRRRSGGP